MRILIVEDDKAFRGNLRSFLTLEGFAVDETDNAKKGAQLAAENIYDVILLDIMMPGPEMMNPGRGGEWLLRSLRQARNNALIIMITGQAEDDDKLSAYAGGADDYLVKPFKLEELMAKIRAWLKRRHDFLSSDVSSTVLVVGDLRLNLLRRSAIRAGREIPLTIKECAILEYLMRSKGQIKSQTTILQHVSNVDFDGMSNTVEFHIKNLREKIDKDFSVKLIKTIRGSGYMIDDGSAPT